MDKSALQEIETIIEEMLQEDSIELAAMEYVRENKSMTLRLYIDSADGVNMELCARATKVVKKMIDEKDLPYDRLEVSSPGLDRVLKKDRDFIRFQGCRVRIKTAREFDGPRTLSGILERADKEQIILKTTEKTYEIPRQLITTARLNPEI